ncbi:Mov34/MPN/PAD-1 family protein [Saccharothrix deserti]|uniref:Mov34/MPN/PAD-1 family protein n=1 Tax=Saccharothrix deserti TaxID=2593674 RepID=UPI00131BF326|nr:M67 family metallopeptidase [Saccharothrix deserti]
MMTIGQAIVDAIIGHARADHPRIACGLVAGPAGSDRPERFIPMVNAEDSSVYWQFDTGQQLEVYRALEARGEEPIIVYRSYPESEAYPSKMDVRFADPDVHHVFVSTRDPDNIEIRSFRIEDGQVHEEPIAIVPVFGV